MTPVRLSVHSFFLLAFMYLLPASVCFAGEILMDIVLLLDRSGSMSQVPITGGAPLTFEQIKVRLLKFIDDELPNNSNVSVITIGDDAEVVARILVRNDQGRQRLREKVEPVRANAQRTFLVQGIQLGLAELKRLSGNGEGSWRHRLMFLVTDGRNDPPIEHVGKRFPSVTEIHEKFELEPGKDFLFWYAHLGPADEEVADFTRQLEGEAKPIDENWTLKVVRFNQQVVELKEQRCREWSQVYPIPSARTAAEFAVIGSDGIKVSFVSKLSELKKVDGSRSVSGANVLVDASPLVLKGEKQSVKLNFRAKNVPPGQYEGKLGVEAESGSDFVMVTPKFLRIRFVQHKPLLLHAKQFRVPLRGGEGQLVVSIDTESLPQEKILRVSANQPKAITGIAPRLQIFPEQFELSRDESTLKMDVTALGPLPGGTVEYEVTLQSDDSTVCLKPDSFRIFLNLRDITPPRVLTRKTRSFPFVFYEPLQRLSPKFQRDRGWQLLSFEFGIPGILQEKGIITTDREESSLVLKPARYIGPLAEMNTGNEFVEFRLLEKRQEEVGSTEDEWSWEVQVEEPFMGELKLFKAEGSLLEPSNGRVEVMAPVSLGTYPNHLHPQDKVGSWELKEQNILIIRTRTSRSGPPSPTAAELENWADRYQMWRHGQDNGSGLANSSKFRVIPITQDNKEWLRILDVAETTRPNSARWCSRLPAENYLVVAFTGYDDEGRAIQEWSDVQQIHISFPLPIPSRVLIGLCGFVLLLAFVEIVLWVVCRRVRATTPTLEELNVSLESSDRHSCFEPHGRIPQVAQFSDHVPDEDSETFQIGKAWGWLLDHYLCRFRQEGWVKLHHINPRTREHSELLLGIAVSRRGVFLWSRASGSSDRQDFYADTWKELASGGTASQLVVNIPVNIGGRNISLTMSCQMPDVKPLWGSPTRLRWNTDKLAS